MKKQLSKSGISMQAKRPTRFELNNKFLAATRDGIVVGKTTGGGAHLTILVKDGRLTIHCTFPVCGPEQRKHIYLTEMAYSGLEDNQLEQAMEGLLRRLSTKRLPNIVWVLPNELLVPRIKHESKKKIKLATASWREIRSSATTMNSRAFANSDLVMGFTTRGTLIMRTKWGSFLLLNKKTCETFESFLKRNKLFAAVEKGRKMLDMR